MNILAIEARVRDMRKIVFPTKEIRVKKDIKKKYKNKNKKKKKKKDLE
jgi:hypothetical protein